MITETITYKVEERETTPLAQIIARELAIILKDSLFIIVGGETTTLAQLAGVLNKPHSRWEFIFYAEKLTGVVSKYINRNNIEILATFKNGNIRQYNIGNKHISNKVHYIKDRLSDEGVDHKKWLMENDLDSFDDFYNIQILNQTPLV